MRTRALSTLLVLLTMSGFVVAQDQPKLEVFGGYQFTRAGTGTSLVRDFNMNGWNASLSGYFDRNLGITADFSGSYGTASVFDVDVSNHLYTYMFGPVLRTANKSPFQLYAHALFGGGHITATAAEPFGLSRSDNGFTWAVGGGVDYKALPHISVRLGQFDFLQTHFGGSINNFRYSGGIVGRF